MAIGRVDRANAARALAKAIAFKECGKDREAERWAILLLQELQCAEIIRPGRLPGYWEGGR